MAGFGAIRLMPSDHGYPFVRWRHVAYVISLAMIVASIIAFFAIGLNFGIDFRGGVLVQAGNPQVADVRDYVNTLDLQGVEAEVSGDQSEVAITFTGAQAAARAGVVETALVGGDGGGGGRFACTSSGGIEETGGAARLALRLPPPLPPLNDIRTALGALGLGNVQVQEFGGPNTLLIRVEAQSGAGVEAERAQQAASATVRETLLAMAPMCILRTEVVGAKVSGELVRAGAFAVVLALVLMLVYIWFRFEWQFSIGAVAALVHDVTITLGMLAVTGFEFNLPSIAALLTIIGYSMNDTVVVYDRIREKMRKYKKMPMDELINFAINKTLSRTIMTSVTTMIALIALFVLGGEVLRGFSFAMIWGIVIGTYSSIFVAAPLLLVTGVRAGASPGGAKPEGEVTRVRS